MIKLFSLISGIIFISACAPHDQRYYYQHPQALQEALIACQNQSVEDVHCQKLKPVARNINKLAYKLQSDPQKFGLDIIELEANLVQKQTDYKRNPSADNQKDIEQLKATLEHHLAIVKWLESPQA
ncbi:MAG TPA: hypothetical protein DCG13_04695 [Legionellales bacterium]|nr:hypothetical protein [Legionellales bacterium]|tara:strand:- start:2079 stop:2456 length:378 start_codon:yes stop_codon:yes gene_type:complete